MLTISEKNANPIENKGKNDLEVSAYGAPVEMYYWSFACGILKRQFYKEGTIRRNIVLK